jgi:FlaA1/EpsC-like NDP-sugar epimerase
MHRLRSHVLSAALTTAMLAGVATAQTVDKRTLTIDGAKKAAAAAVAEAKKNNEGGVIAIVDDEPKPQPEENAKGGT